MNARSEPIDSVPSGAENFDFEALFAARYERIARVITRVVKDPARAEELAIDVFWKLWRSPRAHGAGAGGWLYRTAVRAGLDELRKQSRREKYEQFFSLGRAVATPEQLQSASEEQSRVRSVLASLNGRMAELLLLRSDGLSYQDLAQTLDLNPASIGTLLSRAQEAFRKEYIKRYGER